MADPNIAHFDDSNFEAEVLNSEIPVLVDFWAEWCGPCHMLSPIIGELADEYQGKVKVGKVDVDSARQTAAQFGIQNIPTVILFEDGKAVETFVGVRKKGEYQAKLDAKLGIG
ncbi:MAG: thioredoxin [Phycisphaerae bacterium]